MIRVVIAEDQAMVLGALAALLELERDIEVAGRASNGAEAIEVCRRLRPDILITDVEMPELDGYELCAALKSGSQTAHVPVLICSSLGQAQDLAVVEILDGACSQPHRVAFELTHHSVS